MNERQPSNEVIVQQLSHICEKLDKQNEANERDHGRIFKAIEEIKVDAAATRTHTHPHCEDCIRHGEAIGTLKKWVYGIGAGTIIAAIKAWWPR